MRTSYRSFFVLPLVLLFSFVVSLTGFEFAFADTVSVVQEKSTTPHDTSDGIDLCAFAKNDSYKLLLTVFFGMIGILSTIISILFGKDSFESMKEYSSWATFGVPMKYHILSAVGIVTLVFFIYFIAFQTGNACPPYFVWAIYFMVVASLYVGIRLIYLLFRPW